MAHQKTAPETVKSPFYMVLPVQPILRDWVESIFIMNWDADLYTFDPVYTYPWSVTTHIYFTINNEPSYITLSKNGRPLNYPKNFVVGPKLVRDTVSLGRRRHVVGVAFRAGGLERFAGVPAHELVNKRIDASLIWGMDVLRVSEQLQSARNNEECLRIVEGFLLRKVNKLRTMSAFDQAVIEMVNSSGRLSVKTLAEYAGISMRQFERKSLHSLGISPKLFAKITRFTGACIYKEAHPEETWSRIAYEFGYADQMHLIHDFKTFSGATPSAIDRRMKANSVKLITAIEGKL